jgi:hypothetical protein
VQAAEFLQVATSEDAKYANAAEIEILWKETLHGPLTMDIVALKKADSDLPCLVFVTRNSTSEELAVLEPQPMALRLSTTGVVSETVLVNRPLFQMAVNALVRLKPRLQLDKPDEAEREVDQESEAEKQAVESDEVEATTATAHNASTHQQQRIHLVGYSTGGAVASYVAMLLDGTLHVTAASEPKGGKATPSLPSLSQARPCIGAASGRVYCVTLGCPPCISRSVVPQYVISLINGDDLVARAGPDNLMELKSSVHTLVREKAKESAASRWLKSSARVAGGLLGVASRGIREHATAKHDYVSLKPPGKVFFMKKRKQNQGATFTRVLRGNIREDVLWQLHDIVVSTSMERHHSLEDYIQTLRRV